MSWEFGTTERGIGWFGTDIETFETESRKHLVREIIQNSLDNPIDKTRETPVIVDFSEHTVNTDNFPGLLEYKEILLECRKEEVGRSNNPENNHSKEVLAITEAVEKLNAKTIKVLKISDSNTTGLISIDEGEKTNECGWYRYTRTTGVSTSANTGGSFGHGKMAPFAASALRQTFVLSRFENPISGSYEERCQGLCLAGGRPNPDNMGNELESYFSNFGYFGDKNLKPFKAFPNELAWGAPTDIGTTILLPGWDRTDDWEKSILSLVMITYFAAIRRGWLLIRISGQDGKEKYTLSKENIEEYFGSKLPALINHMEKNEEKTGVELERASYYFKCLMGGMNVEVHTKTDHFFGDIKISFLKLEEDDPLKIKNFAIIRRNMFITDQLSTQNFNYIKLGNFGKKFAALVELDSTPTKQTNGYYYGDQPDTRSGEDKLRAFENASHTELDHTRLTAQARKDGEQHLLSFGRLLKKLAVELTEEPEKELPSEPTLIKKFFKNLNAEGVGDQDNEVEIDPDGDFIFNKVKRKKPQAIESKGNSSEKKPVETKTVHERKKGKKKKRGTNPPGPGDIISESPDAKDDFISTTTLNKLKVVSATQERVEILINISEEGKYRVNLLEVGATSDEKIFSEEYFLEADIDTKLSLKTSSKIFGGILPFVEVISTDLDE